jgi:hypothetical protein
MPSANNGQHFMNNYAYNAAQLREAVSQRSFHFLPTQPSVSGKE